MKFGNRVGKKMPPFNYTVKVSTIKAMIIRIPFGRIGRRWQ